VFPIVLEPCDLGEVAVGHQVVDVGGEGAAAYARLWTALERQRLGPRDVWRPDPGRADSGVAGAAGFRKRAIG
jgi:hypothetical protein